jgi:type II secretory pathway predicted ATPase ExeA
MCAELEDTSSLIGPSLAMVTGPAGRGKSEAAKRYATQTTAIYIPPMNMRSPVMVLREITFELCKLKPVRSEACLAIIGDEMAKNRRVILVDEADLLEMKCLEMLRNVNERYSCPVVLIGEDDLKGRVASRRRISSRIRRHVEFAPVTQGDVGYFFKRSMNLKLPPEAAQAIHRHSRGDWRPVLTAAIAIERAMIASGSPHPDGGGTAGPGGVEISADMVNHVLKNA